MKLACSPAPSNLAIKPGTRFPLHQNEYPVATKSKSSSDGKIMAPTPRRSSTIAAPSSATTNRSGGFGKGLGKTGAGGKGLGKGLGKSKRHRKVMKDTVHGISGFAMTRIGRSIEETD